MANCTQTLTGIAKNCGNVGGVKNIYICNRAEIDKIQMSGNLITGINMYASALFMPYRFKNGQASFTSTVNAGDGNTSVTTDLTISFNRMQTATRLEITALAQADICVIIHDANDIYHFLGADEPAYLATSTGSTGSAKTDINNYQIVIRDECKTFPPMVTPNSVKNVIKDSPSTPTQGGGNTGGGNSGTGTLNIITNVNDSTMGSVTGGGTYNKGETVTVTAIANDGYRFVRWSDNVLDNPRTVKPVVSVSFTAIFEKGDEGSLE